MSIKIKNFICQYKKVIYFISGIIILPIIYWILTFIYNTGNYFGIFLRNIYKIITKC